MCVGLVDGGGIHRGPTNVHLFDCQCVILLSHACTMHDCMDEWQCLLCVCLVVMSVCVCLCVLPVNPALAAGDFRLGQL